MKYREEYINIHGCDPNDFDAEKYLLWVEEELNRARKLLVFFKNTKELLVT